MEFISQGIVSAYININSVLIIWLINGIVLLINKEKYNRSQKNN